MAQEQNNMPAGFGGLMRYNEEYDSKIKFGPQVVIGLIIVVVIFVISLKYIFPGVV
ncbi:MAG: preprotein translocase subunit Sec61beta [Nanoarchaeota archaeon]|nr:preprotein translocase subunit Sec61beta [Nanoarchaeota archaeon]